MKLEIKLDFFSPGLNLFKNDKSDTLFLRKFDFQSLKILNLIGFLLIKKPFKMKNYFFVVLSTLLIFSACTNDSNTEDMNELTTQEMVETTEDAAISQTLIEVAADEADYQIEYRSGGGNPPDECPVITSEFPRGTYPNTITIDWGTDGCEGPRGHILMGKLIVTISAPMNEDGATKTMTTENFFVDGAQLEGTRTKSNTGTDALGNKSYSRSVDLTITFPDGDQAQWQANHFLSQIEGGETITLFDNVFQITGNSSGVNRNGGTYSSEIVEPLVKRKDCGWVESGLRSITRNDRNGELNYGDGECNRLAEVTLPNGQVRNIILRRWW